MGDWAAVFVEPLSGYSVCSSYSELSPSSVTWILSGRDPGRKLVVKLPDAPVGGDRLTCVSKAAGGWLFVLPRILVPGYLCASSYWWLIICVS